jgi:hypothetical protein
MEWMGLEVLVNFIRQKKEQGKTEQEIVEMAKAGGWKEENISQAILVVNEGVPLPDSVSKETPKRQHESMWVIFQNVLLFISLAFFASSLHGMLSGFVEGWQNINSHIPYLSFSMAGLIVTGPIFILLFYLTNSTYLLKPELKLAVSKKRLNYVILVITFLVLMARMVTLVSSLIGTMINQESIWQVLVTLSVAGPIFGYYLYEVRYEKRVLKKQSYAVISMALALMTIILSYAGLKLQDTIHERSRQSELTYRYESDNYKEPVYTPTPKPLKLVAMNTPVSGGKALGMEFEISNAEITESYSNYTLKLDLLFTAKSNCGIENYCSPIPARITLANAEMLRLHTWESENELPNNQLQVGEKYKTSVSFGLEKADLTDTYYVWYQGSEAAPRLELQFKVGEEESDEESY